MRKYLAIISLITVTVFCLIFLPNSIDALELVRQKNTNTVIVFPMVGTGGDFLSSVGTTDTEVDTYADGTNPDGFVDMTEPTEVGATGIYYIAMTTAELNFEYIIIRVAVSTGNGITQHILIRTTVADPATPAVTVTDIDTASLVKVWAYSTRELSHFDEDNTTIDIDATTIGTVENVPAVDVVTIETVDATDQLDTAAATVTVTDIDTASLVKVWAYSTRELSHFDEDNTTIDIDATTIGTVENSNVVTIEGGDATDAINAEALDVLNTDTFAEPGQGNPAATTSIQAKIGYIYKFLRNLIKTTANTIEYYNDAGAVVDQKATISDDGTTFSRGEIVTGP